MQKRTKIVCTLGPSSDDKETIKKMIKAGMNVARLNFSHGTYENHESLIKKVRELSEELNEPIAVIQDLQGPRIRLGLLPEKGVMAKEGQILKFDTTLADYDGEKIPVDFHELCKFVKKGERMLIDDGRVEVKIIRVQGSEIDAEIIYGGTLLSHKGINVPDSKLIVSALTDKDKNDVRFGVEHKVDYIALSFVTSPDDILDLRYLIQEYEKEMKQAEQPIRIIAKIERREAVKNIKKILEVADGIMVARGDLGIEIPAQDVPLAQKKLVDEALLSAKSVIVATQMLDSMQNNPRPTRAEVSDVANAVIDHTDAVMLSNETASGKYPVETVATMSEIIKKTEDSVYDDLEMSEYVRKKKRIDEVVSQVSRLLAEEVGAKLILAASITGETARMISRHRPELPIVVATSTERVRNQINLCWGVFPFVLVPCRTIEELIERSVLHLKEKKMIKSGDRIIIAAGEPVGQAGHVNLLEVREVE